MVDIDKILYGFMPGRGTGDAVLILRRLTGKFIAKSKIFFCISGSGKGF